MSGKIRFAPSPTGFLHEGHLLSALYVWAAARKWDLKIHLRIEDHDQSRMRPAYVEGIYEDLAWFGFHYDSESIQSKRWPLYEQALSKLEAQGLVYPCYCSRKQIEAENPKSETGEIVYQGKCRYLVGSRKSEVGSGIAEVGRDSSRPHNLRFVVPDKVIQWHDLRLGDFAENPKLQCGDFPIRDREGQWTYQFAVCVDDIDEGITHIVRGEDIRNSTARQIALREALGATERPIYLHHALISDSSGKKLSKRELAYSLRQERESGTTPEILLGRVCYKAKMQETPAPLSLEQAISILETYI
jgi:glutamyl-tRNA synthetase/glutamyl-Q tRNA(Asp) synthetase